MSSIEYYTYWSIKDTPSNSISSESIFLLISIISIISFILIWKFKKQDFEKNLFLILISIFISISIPAYSYLKFFTKNNTEERLDKFLNSDKIHKVEGKISSFEIRIQRHSKGSTIFESFIVDSVRFEYSDNTMAQFNRFGGSHYSLFKNGLNVRISYLKDNKANVIQKIEIAKNK